MRRAGSNALKLLSCARSSARAIAALRRWQLLGVAFAVFTFAQAASAQSIIYQIRGNATAGSNNLWAVNPTTGAETLVYTGYPGGNAATLAQRPSDGMLFYAINSAAGDNGAVYRFNPATPSVAPVLLGNLGPAAGVNVSSGFRMAFSSAGTLYYMVGSGGTADPNTLYTVNQNTGLATKVTTITGTNDGGDMAFSGNTIYIVDQNRNLFTATTAGGAATALGTINFGGATPNTIGIAFDGTGRMLVQTVSAAAGGQFWSVTGTTAALIGAISGGGTATGDLASANVPAPDLSITKTNNLSSVYQGESVAYTIVVTNNGTYTVTGTVTDTVPAALTSVTWTCAASAGSTCAAASGSGNSISTSATLAAAGTATYTVSGTVSNTASGTLSNTATVALPSWLTDATPANNSATDSDPVNVRADLSITKTDGLATINPGSAETYTIVVSNAASSSGAANGAIVTDTVPASLTSVAWTCGSPTGGATCGAASGSGNNISTTANLPVGSSVTYTVTGTLSTTATGTLSNTATVITPASGVSDPTDLSRTGAGNNSATDTTTINAASDLAVSKTVNNSTPNVGNTIAYTVTVTNNGPVGATNVHLTDLTPVGLTFVSATPSGATTYNSATGLWTIGSLANGASATLTINAKVNAGTGNTTITNTTSGLGADQFDPTSANNVGSVSLRVTSADLSLTMSVNNSTPAFGQNVTYTVTVSNAGPDGATNVAVKDVLPASLVFVSATPSTGSYNSATGIWTVGSIANGANVTLQIVAQVNAFGTITNTAQVSASDQSDPDSTPNNNVSTEDDQASVNIGSTPPSITLCKTILGQTCPPPALPNQQPGTDISYTVTFTNAGGSPAVNFVLTDPDPGSGLKLNTHTDFKVGSVTTNLGTTGLTVTVAYSNNNGATWTYTPVSGGGGAPAGYDRNVTHIRWSFTGSLSQTSPNNAGSVGFTVRIQ